MRKKGKKWMKKKTKKRKKEKEKDRYSHVLYDKADVNVL